MLDNLFKQLFENPWSVPIAIVCLSLSIFVHELGHFLVARWRGVYADRFSFFGLGKPIVSWHWRGVEWCICWIPIGAYVSIPQLADLGEIEGGTDSEALRKLPKISYTDKVLVSVAGAAFNVVFASILATVLWFTGQEVAASSQTTQIGYVSETQELPDKTIVPGAAYVAGLRPLDVIRSIDGQPTQEWEDVIGALVLGSGKSNDGRRQAEFVIERDGKPMTIVVHPQLATEDRVRRVGIAPVGGYTLAEITAGKAAAKAGLQVGDRIVAINGQTTYSIQSLIDALAKPAGTPVRLTVERLGARQEVSMGAIGPTSEENAFGARSLADGVIINVPPPKQLWGVVKRIFRTMSSLVSRHSDIGLDKMSGPIGIVNVLREASTYGIVALIGLTMMLNVSFAVLNLMPIPVLDGGHIVFATIAKLRGKPLPINLVASTQGIFFVLLISTMIYVSVFDVRRIARQLGNTPPPPPAKSEPAGK